MRCHMWPPVRPVLLFAHTRAPPTVRSQPLGGAAHSYSGARTVSKRPSRLVVIDQCAAAVLARGEARVRQARRDPRVRGVRAEGGRRVLPRLALAHHDARDAAGAPWRAPRCAHTLQVRKRSFAVKLEVCRDEGLLVVSDVGLQLFGLRHCPQAPVAMATRRLR